MIIGLAGKIGAGKTTAALDLCDNYGFTRNRFAGPIKDMMRALGLTEQEIDGDLKNSPCPLLCGRTPRHAMQTLGTEWGRDLIHPDFWVSVWKSRCSSDRIVADDVRFPNEAAAIRAMGGKVIMIKRPIKVPADLVDPAGSPFETKTLHASERFEFEPDTEVVNDGTLEQLYTRVRAAACLVSQS